LDSLRFGIKGLKELKIVEEREEEYLKNHEEDNHLE